MERSSPPLSPRATSKKSNLCRKKEPPLGPGAALFFLEVEAHVEAEDLAGVVAVVGVEQQGSRQVVLQALQDEAIDRVVLPEVGCTDPEAIVDFVVQPGQNGEELGVLVVVEVLGRGARRQA